ncbi:MAG: SDR family NAD(P)-dependent oxidoreductase [Immundisolibacter sp.]|uniref:SDR family NAD(P)-dependent oxidoreductase n=1 Tax=Immundisolibacter sp. TaxID=1934948 RepID=UPI003EDFCD60
MLDKKIAIVTGAGSGIGRAIAARLHAEGAHVVLAGRRRDKLQETAHLLGDRTLVVATDVTRPAEVQTLADAASDFGGGKIDILVNNAGAMRFAPIENSDEAHWQDMMDVNCWGPRRLMAAVLPAMRAAGGGSIVNIASIAGENAFPGAGAYGAAKRALRHISQVLAMEEAGHGIRVNVICPGVVEETELLQGAVPPDKQAQFLNTFAQVHPLGRNGKPDDVADAVLFFASGQSRWITGVVLPLDGGRHLASNRPKLD